ncbi:AAA family ATPase [Allonocardiopsis opalescens]|uniref:ATPase AAA-type core domain-containing protein n=1 Tax=Allonocardiopsis opalescens TaxID=1144618 RepID=A0A2T0Q320_9ACTN|nr:ATP-binding protein [Allonocardiopsis opalescens]PRX98183.1 hypothetical protein CLV72_105537 [Allonocardiopsis opalescens]
MLLSFHVANHRSLRDEQRLSLVPPHVRARGGLSAVPVTGIFGANAAGKSSLLDALGRMRREIRNDEPGKNGARTPFALDPDSRARPTRYVVELLLGGSRFEYGYSVDDAHITEEWLYQSASAERTGRVVFERTGMARGCAFPPAPLRASAETVAADRLLLPAAADAGQQEAQRVYDWFGALCVYPDQFDGRCAVNQNRLDRLSMLLRAMDTGVDKVVVRPGGAVVAGEVRGGRGPSTCSGEGDSWMDELAFRSGPLGMLAASDLSGGTRTLVKLCLAVLATMDAGNVLVVDDFGAGLHLYVSRAVVDSFQERRTNPRNAQLIFASHDSGLMDRIRGDRVLRRDQVWFVEKDGDGASRLYPVSDFGVEEEAASGAAAGAASDS